ncbi:MAG: class I SAM-dependent methyltransferase [Balneolales bacterium]|nr:class I SAM-dependent methyltransferase [Balneolales bacterium]
MVTCFETLEHVGDFNTALNNILGLCSPGGAVIITVPIEIGPWGIGKFVVKRFVYGYSLHELNPVSTSEYFSTRLKGKI